MIQGPEPGSVNCDITWTRLPNTTLARVQNDSLVHLFSKKKPIKRRTKLLNSYLREQRTKTISYPDYIKIKTAILRTLSDNDETSDSSVLSDINDLRVPHVHSEIPKASALRTLLQEMMLDTDDMSGEEKKGVRRKKKKGKSPRSRITAEDLLSSEDEDEIGASSNLRKSSIRRPVGRPRKSPKPSKNPPKSRKKPAKSLVKPSRAKSRKKPPPLKPGKAESASSSGPDESEIITVMVDDDNSNGTIASSGQDPLEHESPPFKRLDENSHIFDNISKMISAGVQPTVAADASKIYSTEDEEFLSPRTSDCESEDHYGDHIDRRDNRDEGIIEAGGSMNLDDDMFEEEKVFTEAPIDSGTPGKSSLKNPLVADDLKNVSRTADEIPIDDTEFSFVENSQVEAPDLKFPICSKYPKRFLESNEVETFTQEFDALCNKSPGDIEEYVETVVKDFDEKFWDKSPGITGNSGEICDDSAKKYGKTFKDSTENIHKIIKNSAKKSDETFKNSAENFGKIIETSPEKSDKSVENSAEKSTKKSSASSLNSEDSQKRIVTNPKTPANIRKNLMSILDSVSDSTEDSKLHPEDMDDNSGPESRNSVTPADSGIDEDSSTLLHQKVANRDGPVELAGRNEASPGKKAVNVKITCEEVLTSKYMIVKSPTKNLGESGDRSDSEAADDGRSRSGQARHSTKKFLNLDEAPGAPEGDNPPHLSLKQQLNEYDSDLEDLRSPPEARHLFGRSENALSTDLVVATESESLKYLLKSISGRQHYMQDCYEPRIDVLQEELLMSSKLSNEDEEDAEDEEAEEDARPLSPLPRPTCIPEFVEGSNLIPSEMMPSFTLDDIAADDDVYMLEIPKTVLEENLQGQRFKLMERRVIIGDRRYDIQRRDTEAMSCVLHCGDDRNRYKTGIIEPLDHIIMRQQVRDDLTTTPKVEIESSIAVPFPKNVKSRNPLVEMESPGMRAEDEETVVDCRKRKLCDRMSDDRVFKKRRIFRDEEDDDRKHQNPSFQNREEIPQDDANNHSLKDDQSAIDDFEGKKKKSRGRRHQNSEDSDIVKEEKPEDIKDYKILKDEKFVIADIDVPKKRRNSKKVDRNFDESGTLKKEEKSEDIKSLPKKEEIVTEDVEPENKKKSKKRRRHKTCENAQMFKEEISEDIKKPFEDSSIGDCEPENLTNSEEEKKLFETEEEMKKEDIEVPEGHADTLSKGKKKKKSERRVKLFNLHNSIVDVSNNSDSSAQNSTKRRNKKSQKTRKSISEEMQDFSRSSRPEGFDEFDEKVFSGKEEIPQDDSIIEETGSLGEDKKKKSKRRKEKGSPVDNDTSTIGKEEKRSKKNRKLKKEEITVEDSSFLPNLKKTEDVDLDEENKYKLSEDHLDNEEDKVLERNHGKKSKKRRKLRDLEDSVEDIPTDSDFCVGDSGNDRKNEKRRKLKNREERAGDISSSQFQDLGDEKMKGVEEVKEVNEADSGEFKPPRRRKKKKDREERRRGNCSFSVSEASESDVEFNIKSKRRKGAESLGTCEEIVGKKDEKSVIPSFYEQMMEDSE